MDYTAIFNAIIALATTTISAFGSKYIHDKNKQNVLDQSLTIASQYAKDIVINLSQRGDLTNSEKFKTAYLFVVDKLKKQNIHVTEQTITNKIVEAYQTYKKDGGDIHKFIPDVVNENTDDVEKAVSQVADSVKAEQTQQPVQPAQPTVVEPVQQPVETKVKEPKTDAPKTDVAPAVDEPKVDAPQSDAPVDNGTQQAPVNPYIK